MQFKWARMSIDLCSNDAEKCIKNAVTMFRRILNRVNGWTDHGCTFKVQIVFFYEDYAICCEELALDLWFICSIQFETYFNLVKRLWFRLRTLFIKTIFWQRFLISKPCQVNSFNCAKNVLENHASATDGMFIQINKRLHINHN